MDTPLFSSVITFHGALLACDRGTSRVMAVDQVPETLAHVGLYRPQRRPDLAFLVPMTPEPLTLSIEGDTTYAPIVSYRVRPSNLMELALRRPGGADHLCSEMRAAPDLPERVILNRPQIGDWEQFVAAPMPPHLVPGWAIALAERLEQLFQRPLTGQAVLDILGQPDPVLDPAIAAVEALGRLLPDDELRWLGARILSSPVAIDRLARLLPRDVWAQTAVPALAEWTRDRDAPKPRAYVLPKEFDHLSLPMLASHSVTLGHGIASAARAEVMPRKLVCIMAAARNEGIYLLDWIAYHRSIGVEDFFIYSNNNDDGSDDLLALLAEHSEITWIDNHVDAGVSPQLKGYGHTLSILPDILDYRWTLCIDVDEFFSFDTRRFGSLQDYVNWHEADHVDAIALSWLMFGSSAELWWRDEPIWERMTRCRLDVHVKTLFRTNRFRHSWCHFPVSPPGFPPTTFVNSAGDLHCAPGQNRDPNVSLSPRADEAWICHYYFRSAEEFLWKKARNTGDHPATGLGFIRLDPGHAQLFLGQHLGTGLFTDRRMDLCAKGAAAEKTRLLGLPGIATCNAGLKSNFQKISAEILGHLQTASQEDKTLETFAGLFGR